MATADTEYDNDLAKRRGLDTGNKLTWDEQRRQKCEAERERRDDCLLQKAAFDPKSRPMPSPGCHSMTTCASVRHCQLRMTSSHWVKCPQPSSSPSLSPPDVSPSYLSCFSTPYRLKQQE